jgi:hypothetical protein
MRTQLQSDRKIYLLKHKVAIEFILPLSHSFFRISAKAGLTAANSLKAVKKQDPRATRKSCFMYFCCIALPIHWRKIDDFSHSANNCSQLPLHKSTLRMGSPRR